MQLTLGFSPCPNDTFMFDALVHSRFPAEGIEWKISIEDVETLNQMAINGILDVTKMSFATWLNVQDTYDLLSAGAALGYGCGPLLISREPLDEEQINKGPVAIPGVLTTANMLLSIAFPKATNRLPMLFSEIEGAVLSGNAIAGVIIHENRFTYESHGLHKVLDLGEYWEGLTCLPIPLGAIAARRSLGTQTLETLSKLVKQSVQMAMDQPDMSMPFVRFYAQEMSDTVMQAHIETYVNSYSLDLGESGWQAIRRLQSLAAERQI